MIDKSGASHVVVQKSTRATHPDQEDECSRMVVTEMIDGVADERNAFENVVGVEIAVPVIAARTPAHLAGPWEEAPPWASLILESAGVPVERFRATKDIGLLAIALPSGDVALVGYFWGGSVTDMAAESRRMAGSVLAPATTILDELEIAVSLGSDLEAEGLVVRRVVVCIRMHGTTLVAVYDEQRVERFDRVAPYVAPSVLLWVEECDG